MHKLKQQHIKDSKRNRIHNSTHPVIGLTGSIATGKTTTSQILVRLGIPLIEADSLVKKIYTSESSFKYIENLCPKAISLGKIDFTILRKLFFNSDVLKEKVENFIYSQLPTIFKTEYDKLDFTQFDFFVYDIPLLFEKKLQNQFDITAVVYCTKDMQKERLKKRDNIDSKLINSILSQQIDIDQKAKLGNFVIDNTSTLDNLTRNANLFINSISTQ